MKKIVEHSVKAQKEKDLEIEQKLCECHNEPDVDDEVVKASAFLNSKKMKRIRLAMKHFCWRLVRLKLTPWEVSFFILSLIEYI